MTLAILACKTFTLLAILLQVLHNSCKFHNCCLHSAVYFTFSLLILPSHKQHILLLILLSVFSVILSQCAVMPVIVLQGLQARIASLGKHCRSVGVGALWCAALLLLQPFVGVADIAAVCSPFADVVALFLVISHFASVAHSLALQWCWCCKQEF